MTVGQVPVVTFVTQKNNTQRNFGILKDYCFYAQTD
ncbi:hypothetical protein CLV32_2220 [Pedobacter duraquae]|uniref:Uncharacterized protein n=1 Tax=Pedobacter duraquae TaxID=425511 RepID=A0A4R6IMC5_9SPHI|nr:hypothetical protein CLV32_2220 [Pedobacter duraquae]